MSHSALSFASAFGFSFLLCLFFVLPRISHASQLNDKLRRAVRKNGNRHLFAANLSKSRNIARMNFVSVIVVVAWVTLPLAYTALTWLVPESLSCYLHENIKTRYGYAHVFLAVDLNQVLMFVLFRVTSLAQRNTSFKNKSARNSSRSDFLSSLFGILFGFVLLFQGIALATSFETEQTEEGCLVSPTGGAPAIVLSTLEALLTVLGTYLFCLPFMSLWKKRSFICCSRSESVIPDDPVYSKSGSKAGVGMLPKRVRQAMVRNVVGILLSRVPYILGGFLVFVVSGGRENGGEGVLYNYREELMLAFCVSNCLAVSLMFDDMKFIRRTAHKLLHWSSEHSFSSAGRQSVLKWHQPPAKSGQVYIVRRDDS
mmetsp:Transcript_20562/g.31083  ORF Transcript_20562/g.31083 Transcript_20562/m.31083 type:complete len:370 (-) Transcript_20562:148-1257(-)